MAKANSLFQYLTSEHLGPADVLYFPANQLLGSWGNPHIGSASDELFLVDSTPDRMGLIHLIRQS